ncbi:MAG: HNH/ENDO VII family nuclease, partial [Phycisphaerae bacterium]
SVDPTGLYEGGSSFTPDFSANSVSFNTSVGSSPTSLTGSTSSNGYNPANGIGSLPASYTLPSGITPGQSLAGINFGSQPSAASLLGGGGYAQTGMASPNNGMATPSEINAASTAGVQAYLNSANAALSNPSSFQTYGSNANPSSSPTINMGPAAYSPGDFAQAFGNSLAQSGALPNPSVWGPQAQEMFGPNPVTNRVFGALQAGGGAVESVFGLGLLGVGGTSEAGSLGASTPVSVPAMIAGGIWTANGVDNFQAGLRQLWTGQPVQTLTSQAVTDVTGSPTAGAWVNAGIGISSGLPSLFSTATEATAAGPVDAWNTAAQTSLWTRADVAGATVYQRSDLINPDYVSPKDVLGRTNLQLMQEGLAPYGPDNELINLHHMLQTNDSPLAEMTKTFHQQYGSIIHINPPSIPSGIDRFSFNIWKNAYWMTRAQDFGGGNP